VTGLAVREATMGSSYRFACDACGYEVEVSGGIDYGMICATATIICRDCRSLHTVTISKRPWRVMDGWRPKAVHCPKSRNHAVEYWEHPGRCPRCGKELRRSDEPVILWD